MQTSRSGFNVSKHKSRTSNDDSEAVTNYPNVDGGQEQTHQPTTDQDTVVKAHLPDPYAVTSASVPTHVTHYGSWVPIDRECPVTVGAAVKAVTQLTKPPILESPHARRDSVQGYFTVPCVGHDFCQRLAIAGGTACRENCGQAQ